MRQRLIVFDIDGTLLQSIGTHHRAMEQAMAASELVHRDPEWSHYANHTDSGVFYEAYEKSFGVPPSDAACRAFEALFERCYDRLRGVADDVEIPGAAALLRRLEASGDWLVAYATGSYRGPALHKLQCLGVDGSSCVLATASEFRTRRDIVADAVRRRLERSGRIVHHRMVSVGDGPWDASTAAELGMDFVGVGCDERAQRLIELGARVVVRDFADWPRVVDALEFD